MAKAKYTKGKDGYFKTRVWSGRYDEHGKKHCISLRSKKSSADLEKKVNEHKQALAERKVVSSTNQGFQDYARYYLKTYKSGRSKNTIAMYENIIEKHFSALETVRLSNISRIHYMLVINNADGKERTQQQISMIFKQVIKSAIADKYLAPAVYTDIFENVDKIKHKAKEKRPLMEYEKSALGKADFKEMDKAFVHILYGCGLRRGECLALRVSDINFKTRSLTVERALAFDGNNPYIKETKTANGRRTVPIPLSVFPVIEEYATKLRFKGQSELFQSRNGGWLTKSGYDKMWNRIIKAMQEVSEEQIDGLTAHIFRHNFCTNLCYQIPTISIKKIAQLLGDTEKMVIEVYNHIITEKEDANTAVDIAMNF